MTLISSGSHLAESNSSTVSVFILVLNKSLPPTGILNDFLNKDNFDLP